MKKISVYGAGAWGTALAAAVERAGNDVTIWAREGEVIESINSSHVNDMFLAGVPLSENIKATSDLADIINSDAILMVSPAQYLRSSCESLKQAGIGEDVVLVICSKGIENGSLKMMSDVIKEVFPNPVTVLSGPTFAHEVAKSLPASVTLACENHDLCSKLASSMESDSFKIFKNDDIIGAQIGGSVKNVIAIACGISEGKQLGENAKAALITKGVKEMKRICVAMGGNAETLLELCGVGDLILTCSSRQSRNMSLGFDLGSGKSFEEIMKGRKTVAEGVASSQSVVALADKLGVEVPICKAVYDIVHGNADIEHTIKTLIQRS